MTTTSSLRQRRSVLVGLVGAGLQASRTPRLHEREGAEHGLTYIYKVIDLDALGLTVGALPEIMTAAERLGFDGLNITYPCKRAVLDLLDELSSDARAIGAVNTVIFKGSRRFGHNTDWSGFAESFGRSLPDVSRDRIVQLGAGGAGAAVAHALLTLGAGELSIVDTERQRAASLAEALRARYGADRARAIEDVRTAISGADGVVNATPVGMDKFPGLPVQPSLLRPRHWVADVVYFPLETELLREAKVRGCRTMSGAGMAVFQAAEAFRLFSGEKPNQERMLLHFENM